MADRKVSVELELRAGQFKGEAKATAHDVENLSDKVEELDRDITKIPPDAAKAGAALKLLGGEADAAGRKLENIGDKRTNLAALDAKIRTTRAEVRKLADEFAKTGDVEIFKKLGDSQGKLSALTTIRKDIAESITDGAKDAAQSPELRQIGMALGGALAVPLVAALGGALAGATGLGIAGVGLAGAVLGDPKRFQGAWGVAIRSVKDDFLKATAPFTLDVYDGLARIGPLVSSWHLDKIFKDAKGYADPLFDGVQDLTTGLVRGVGALVEKGGPAVHALSEGMSILGQASDDALGSIADGAQGGAYALKDLAVGVGGVVRLFGELTGAAEKAYGFIHDDPVVAALATMGASIPLSIFTDANGNTKELRTNQHGLELQAIAAGHAFSQEGDDLTVLSQKLGAAAVTSDNLAASMEGKLFSSLMNIDQATLSIAESQTRIQETFKESKKVLGEHADQLDITTARGQANREAVLASVSANQQLYQAQVAAGMSAEDAAVQYDANTVALEKQLKQAGLTQEQIDGLIGKYSDVPDIVNTQIAIEGLTQAISNLEETLRLIAGIKDRSATITITTVYNEKTGQRLTGNSRLGGGSDRATGGIRHAATGMIVAPSNPGTLIGEPQTGGEALIPMQGIAASQAAWLGQTALSGYGYNVVPRSVKPGGGGMPSELTLNATFLDPHTGDVMRKQAITWSIDRGRDPGDFFTAA